MAEMSLEHTDTARMRVIRQALDGWKVAAACRDMPSGLFLAEGTMSAADESAAKEICRECFVIDACLAEAIERDSPFGVWGGMTPEERLPLRRAWKTRRASLDGMALAGLPGRHR